VVTLKRGDEIIGLPVINKRDGNQIGRIKDIVYQNGKRKIEGLIIQREGLLKKSRFIPLEDIVILGDVSVIVNVKRERASSNIEAYADLEEFSDTLGAPVITKEGSELGQISNIVIDEKTGLVEGFEISKGFFDDVFHGRRLVTKLNHIEFINGKLVIQVEDDKRI
jgi:uncharacterized protein YrrD